MANYLIAVGIILGLLLFWVALQNIARSFAKHHPEFGPVTEKLGCGASCACDKKTNCSRI